MKLTPRTNSPLRPLAERARQLSRKCDELIIATAFASDNAVGDVVETALHAGADVRFLTGTVGNVTRKRTFRCLERQSRRANLVARVWQ